MEVSNSLSFFFCSRLPGVINHSKIISRFTKLFLKKIISDIRSTGHTPPGIRRYTKCYHYISAYEYKIIFVMCWFIVQPFQNLSCVKFVYSLNKNNNAFPEKIVPPLIKIYFTDMILVLSYLSTYFATHFRLHKYERRKVFLEKLSKISLF